MDKILNTVFYISFCAYLVLYIIMFYSSLKACFLRNGKGRVRLFLLSLATNPLVIFCLSYVAVIYLGGLLVSIIEKCGFFSAIDRIMNSSGLSFTLTMVGGLVFVLMSLLLSRLVASWLKASNVSLVTFIYLMFAVIFCFSGGRSPEDSSDAVTSDIINIVSSMSSVAAILFLYFSVIKGLVGLTDKRRYINWKLFMIPPSVFLLVYYVFDFLTFMYGGYAANVVAQVYSMIVLLLFIWTFYVIITTINATNAAIEATYESEHDKLTGLYNKGKYMSMKAKNFDNPSSIAIYNFDVNNLKYINDNFGHERGDELIIKAAKSIQAVVSDRVYGFRMGGDEYVMVAVNITMEEAEEIKGQWEQALAEINLEGDVYCVMACGLQFGDGDFDYDELYHRADAEMYLDKKARKEKGLTSHLKEKK